MTSYRPKRALISVYDKSGIVDFVRVLVSEFGIEILSTGGTAALLREHDIPVTLVEEATGFPEMMDGRVKTLHPRIHAGILANRDNADHMAQLAAQDIETIDMVLVNLYPFEETVSQPECSFDQAIEMIDIGGPCMLRAAAKNHRHVLPLCLPSQYDDCLALLRGSGDVDEKEFRCQLAAEAFTLTARYDMMIDAFLAERCTDGEWTEPSDEENPIFTEEGAWYEPWGIIKPLRYGENPHQKASFLHECESCEECDGVITPLHVVSGDEVSYNNYHDGHAALELTKELTRAYEGQKGLGKAVVFVKHTNACGAAVGADPIETYANAYGGDANAAMGGVLCCNFRVDDDFAAKVMATYDLWGKQAGAGGFFVEVWIAPRFARSAIDLVQKAKAWGKRVRLIAVGDMMETPEAWEPRMLQVSGGWLAQEQDALGLNESDWRVVTDRKPTDTEMSDLQLAWLICKHTKSNAITICKNHTMIGNGAGQMSRVMSCRIATWIAEENGHAEALKGSVAASDAFFPFRDGPDILAKAGVTAIIQPGGSKRDEDTIQACNAQGVAMVHTGARHFRH